MRKKADKKNLIISILIILLLVLSIGYAAFSDILTISGTANAKGTFDLEFQNAEIVKNVGADATKTTAVISEDKNTLTVNVADLSYPGSGVEFAVDIVNVGSIPAEIQAVTPTNITGSNKIKVTGLEVIKTDHPKIAAGDKCNIHFTVEWPIEAGEILENESSISFGLEIEYVQSTVEFFEGNISFNDEIYITNVRHKTALKCAYDSLCKVNESIEMGMPEDFYSIDLMDAYETLGSITGETVGEDLVNEIFSKFCMGK